MDTMYRKKSKETENSVSASSKQEENKHISDRYSPKFRPRETNPDTVNSEQRISKNLNQLNRRLVKTPAGERILGKEHREEAGAATEDRGARIVTTKVRVKAQVPLAIIFSCVLVAAVFMYMLSLYVQIEEYSYSIDQMESRIAKLRDEATQLEIRLENKYDLAEIERVATQEYGMVQESILPKKYVSITDGEDVWEETKTEPEKKESFFDAFFALFRKDGE